MSRDACVTIYGGTIFDKDRLPPDVPLTHMLNIPDTALQYVIDGHDACSLPKTVQGGLANDGARDSNAKVDWLSTTKDTSLAHLARVPVLVLTREVRPGDEITFPYSPNFQYSAAIDYARLPESST